MEQKIGQDGTTYFVRYDLRSIIYRINSRSLKMLYLLAIILTLLEEVLGSSVPKPVLPYLLISKKYWLLYHATSASRQILFIILTALSEWECQHLNGPEGVGDERMETAIKTYVQIINIYQII